MTVPCEALVEQVGSALDGSPDQLGTIGSLGDQVLTQEARITFYETKLADAKAQLKVLLEDKLPAAMDAVNMSEFKLTDGSRVSIGNVVAGSIPAANITDACAWLRANGHDGIIKTEVKVSLGKGQDKLALKVRAQLKKLGVELTEKESVAHQTLGAWARELLKQGKVNLPLELLGLFVGRRAKVEH